MSLLVYAISRGEINPASDRDHFWPEDVRELVPALEYHGFGKHPEIHLGADGLSIDIYRVDEPKTDLGEKYHYVGHYIFASAFEIVLIPRLGDLNAFLSQVAPLCMAQLQQSAHDRDEERGRDMEQAKGRLSSQRGDGPQEPGQG
jgi:hypothetical protein